MNFKITLYSLLCFLLLLGCDPSPQERYEEADLLFSEYKYKSAIPIYEELLLKNYSPINILPKLAIAYYTQKEWSKCISTGEKALAEGADYFDVYYRIAQSYGFLGDVKNSEQYFRLIQTKYPDRQEIYKEMGALFFQHKAYQKAAEAYQKLADLNPRDRMIIYNLGSSYELAGNYPKAKEFYERLIALSPHHANANFGLGSIYQKQNKPDEAIKYYEAALFREPEHLSALYNLAKLKQAKSLPKEEKIKAWRNYLGAALKKKDSQKSFIETATQSLVGLGFKKEDIIPSIEKELAEKKLKKEQKEAERRAEKERRRQEKEKSSTSKTESAK